MFINEESIKFGSWQAFERAVGRLLICDSFDGVRLVGQSSDRGADIIGHRAGKRWLFQVKHWKSKVNLKVVDETISALRFYKAQVPVIVALNGFDEAVKEHQRTLLSRGVFLQLWDLRTLINMVRKLPNLSYNQKQTRLYQEDAITKLVKLFEDGYSQKALVVMATGLGKTFVACESVRRINRLKKLKVLIVVHTNELVYQIERSFWPFLTPDQETVVWNGYERPNFEMLERASHVFACLNTIADHIMRGGELPDFNFILIDECHHVGGKMYNAIFNQTNAGKNSGPFLLGLTATPWRADDIDPTSFFGDPIVCIDIVEGLKKGFLSNVDYRMYTDNINWDALKDLQGKSFSPRQINRTLFISEWDDGVVLELKKVWMEQIKPKAIVFCGTIDHAITMRDRINSLGFCNAEAIFSKGTNGVAMEAYERNRILCDFHEGNIDVLCAVDILNEGVDVPDVNIIVFQRVTHSRRIFIQQLGRGLRLAPNKDKVIVLDFVSDIRRFAAGISLKDNLEGGQKISDKKSVNIKLNYKVTFNKVGKEDPNTESFLREWIEDVTNVEDSGEDASVLKFPPKLKGGK